MEIARSDEDIIEFMRIITSLMEIKEHPILVDQYVEGQECEVDAVSDGEDILVPGIMQHLERAGVHSGDSISVYPAQTLPHDICMKLVEHARALARALHVKGLVNIQFIVKDGRVYVIEVNPRSSRTVPYISKVTGVPIVKLATRVILGEKLRDMGYGVGLYKKSRLVAVKMPVFSFEKLIDAEPSLGPEMKSTGEVLGIAESFPQALLKAFKGANMRAPKKGGRIIITVKDEDKGEAIGIARGFADLGVEILGTEGTRQMLEKAGVPCTPVARVSERHPNIMDMIASGTIDLVINTPTRGRKQNTDGFKIRRATVEHSVGCVTAIDTARALLTARQQGRSRDLQAIDITKI